MEFRRSEPQDVESVVPLMRSSGPTAYDYVLCDTDAAQSLAFLRAAFVGTRSEFSHRNHWVAVEGGHTVACGGLRFASQNLVFTAAAVGLFFGFYGPMGAARAIRRGLQTERVIPPPRGAGGTLYHIAVAPSFRGRGVGHQLVEFLLGTLRERGCPSAHLDVAASNDGARRLYERFGFEASRTRDSSLRSRFGHVEPHTHMSRPL